MLYICALTLHVDDIYIHISLVELFIAISLSSVECTRMVVERTGFGRGNVLQLLPTISQQSRLFRMLGATNKVNLRKLHVT